MAPNKTVENEGVLFGVIAFSIYGFLPVYIKWVEEVAPTEVLVHRIIWAIPFGALILMYRRQWPEVRQALYDKKSMFWLAMSAFFISVGWIVFIWAVQQGQVFQASLGYYINPLMNVVIGVLFLGESLRLLQMIAVAIAAGAVLLLTILGGEFPLVAMVLAISFALYGLIRKQIPVGAMPGLFIETAILFPLALGWLLWLFFSGSSVFGVNDINISGLLILGGPVTVLPLLFFALAARRLSLSAIGFLQFIAPSLHLIIGVYYGEPLSLPNLVCFGLIWIAVALFCADALQANQTKVTVAR